MRRAVSISWLLYGSCVAALGQIEKPPEFAEKPGFHKSDAKPVDGTSHVGAMGESISRDLLMRLGSFSSASMAADEKRHFDAAHSLMNQNRPAQALARFEEGLRGHPASVPLGAGRAVALFATGKMDACVNALLALSQSPGGDVRLGALLGETGRLAPTMRVAIEKRLRAYIEANPANGELRYYLAMIISADRDPAPEEAVSLWRSAARLDARDARPCLQLARVETSRNRSDAAIEWLEQALARDPDLADAHYRLARLYTQAGKKELADRHFARFRELRGTPAVSR